MPSKRVNARGVSWANGSTPGTSIGLDQFYVAKPGVSAATINQALAQGLHLLFTPGVYHLDRTIEVNRADTVVLGLGLATLVPDNGVTAMKVADVDGVKLASFLIDAGTTNSPTLLEFGKQGTHTDHATNPSSMQDVFVRVGGQFAGKATTAVEIYSDDTLIDHTWIWRADHGSGVGWNVNAADNGLLVHGDDVLATGLFVEHFKKYDVEWFGERGRTIFFQNEKAYDVPSQAEWMDGTSKGYAGLQGRQRRQRARGLGRGQLLRLHPAGHRGGPRLPGPGEAGREVPQHPDRLARRGRALQPRHQRHGRPGVRNGHRSVHGHQLLRLTAG